MIKIAAFPYTPHEEEAEKATNGYLMALVAVMLGLPMPIINLLATAFFYFHNRKGTYFVRWHCMQAFAAQVVFLFINSSGLYWTLSILFGTREVTDVYIGYMITAVVFNAVELAVTIYTAVKVRQSVHVQWWCFGTFANAVTKA